MGLQNEVVFLSASIIGRSIGSELWKCGLGVGCLGVVQVTFGSLRCYWSIGFSSLAIVSFEEIENGSYYASKSCSWLFELVADRYCFR